MSLRHLISLLSLLLLVCLALPAAAQTASPTTWQTPASDPVIVLRDAQAPAYIGPAFMLLNDVRNEYRLGEVVTRKDVTHAERATTQMLRLKPQDGVVWAVVTFVNQTPVNNWILDFGGLGFERGGIPYVFGVYDGATGRALSGEHVGKNLAVLLPQNQRSTLVFRMKTSDAQPFFFTPVLRSAQTQDFTSPTGIPLIFTPVLLSLLLGAGFLLGLFLLPRGVFVFPLFLFLAWNAFVLSLHVHCAYVALPFGLSPLMLAQTVSLLIALAGTQPLISASGNESSDSILLYLLTGLLVVSLAVVLFLLPIGTMRGFVFVATLAIGYLTVATKLFLLPTPYHRAAKMVAAAWAIAFVCVLTGLVDTFAGAELPFSVDALTPVLFLPCSVLLVLAGASFVRKVQQIETNESIQKLQRSYALSRIQQSKESADQARLLRVIEREREIMEDLRSHEAERVEEMRLARIAADEANQSKGAFLAVISHEIRTPMTGIMGMLRLLQDTEMTTEQREYVATISDSGDAMLALLNDILDFSKIEKGSMVLEKIPFEVKRLVHGVVLLMAGHATKKGIAIDAVIDPAVAETVIGDPTRLRQVLLNLVSNAIKFTKTGGVTIHVRQNLDKAEDDTRNLVYFSVQDTGIGISELAQKNVFSPFAQADSTITRKYGGTGLGLAICKHLIEAMGSHISLKSREGHGANFFFTLDLPVATAADIQAQNQGGAPSGRMISGHIRPLRVLVVDDNEINRKVMDGLLRRDGHTVMQASGGREALELIQQATFDLVFMDIEMPGMDGVTAIKAIRNMPYARLASLPIVAVTGNVQDEDIARYKAAGANEHLAKPIIPDQLRALLFGLALQMGKLEQFPTSLMQLSTDGQDNRLDRIQQLEEDSFATAIAKSTEHETPLSGAQDAELLHALSLETPSEDSPGVSVDDHPLLNAPMLNDLNKTLGVATVRDMMVSVFDKNIEIMEGMRTALAGMNMRELAARAHEMKGMCGNFGLSGLSDAAKSIELSAKSETPDMDMIRAMIDAGDLAKMNDETRTAIDTALKA